jgi:hypothetical protein
MKINEVEEIGPVLWIQCLHSIDLLITLPGSAIMYRQYFLLSIIEIIIWNFQIGMVASYSLSIHC